MGFSRKNYEYLVQQRNEEKSQPQVSEGKDQPPLDLNGKTEEELRALDQKLEQRVKELELEHDQLRQTIYRLKNQLKTISRM